MQKYEESGSLCRWVFLSKGEGVDAQFLLTDREVAKMFYVEGLLADERRDRNLPYTC